MSNEFEDATKTEKKAIAYLVHRTLCLITWSLGLLAILVTVLIPPLILTSIIWALAWTLDWALVLALAWAWALTLAGVLALTLALAGAWALILAGVLAWICDWTGAWTWIPGLLESLNVFIQDKGIIENANIITIITTGLILLLLLIEDIRKSLSKIIKKIGKIFWGKWLPSMDSGKNPSETWRYYVAKVWISMKKTFTESLKLATYPVHLALCCATLFLLLLAIFVSVLILIIRKVILITIMVLSSTGMSLDLEKNKDILKSQSKIKDKIVKAFQGPWLPKIDDRESLSKTWQCNLKKPGC